MDQLWVAVFASFSSFAVAYFGYWLTGKPRLYVYSPNSTGFQLPPAQEGSQPIAIRAGQVVVQNAGRKSANKVQLMAQPGWKPSGYTIVPNIDHEVKSGPQDQWMIEIPYLGPQETVTVQILNGPNIDTVRSLEGPAKVVDVIHQRVYLKWVNAIVLVLMIVGFGTLVFGAFGLIQTLS
ncbi:MAG: hypothetical protein ABIP07_08420 [Sphingomicrobium sp.]